MKWLRPGISGERSRHAAGWATVRARDAFIGAMKSARGPLGGSEKVKVSPVSPVMKFVFHASISLLC